MSENGIKYMGSSEEAETRINNCVKALARFSDDQVERMATDPNNGDGHKPWGWLASPVTQDGDGYRLWSPAGGIMHISSEDRQRMADCCIACTGLNPTGIPGLIQSVESVVSVLRVAQMQTGWRDDTNILSTLEGALRGCKP